MSDCSREAMRPKAKPKTCGECDLHFFCPTPDDAPSCAMEPEEKPTCADSLEQAANAL